MLICLALKLKLCLLALKIIANKIYLCFILLAILLIIFFIRLVSYFILFFINSLLKVLLIYNIKCY
jgi:hypothetical protein